eukprot:GHVL01025386.1.p1 GENE.GHVL01025386.1~~GHVL01025386.1.p1  ORF type:complete len:434 (+),score=77.69 GHVL01025386.1:50-1351(+)
MSSLFFDNLPILQKSASVNFRHLRAISKSRSPIEWWTHSDLVFDSYQIFRRIERILSSKFRNSTNHRIAITTEPGYETAALCRGIWGNQSSVIICPRIYQNTTVNSTAKLNVVNNYRLEILRSCLAKTQASLIICTDIQKHKISNICQQLGIQIITIDDLFYTNGERSVLKFTEGYSKNSAMSSTNDETAYISYITDDQPLPEPCIMTHNSLKNRIISSRRKWKYTKNDNIICAGGPCDGHNLLTYLEGIEAPLTSGCSIHRVNLESQFNSITESDTIDDSFLIDACELDKATIFMSSPNSWDAACYWLNKETKNGRGINFLKRQVEAVANVRQFITLQTKSREFITESQLQRIADKLSISPNIGLIKVPTTRNMYEYDENENITLPKPFKKDRMPRDNEKRLHWLQVPQESTITNWYIKRGIRWKMPNIGRY